MNSPTTDQAIALLMQGQVEDAAKVFNRILQHTPDNAMAYAGLGHCQVRLGRAEDAWHNLLAACRLSDHISQAFSDLAWLAAERDDAETAISAAGKAIALNPNDANAYFSQGRALFIRHRFEEGEAAFSRAGRLSGHFVDSRQHLGNQAFDRADFEAASRHYIAFSQAHPQNVHGLINCGLSLARVNRLQQARAVLEKAVALAPKMPKPWALLAAVLKTTELPDAELIPVLRRAAALSPDGSALQLQLACSLFNEQAFIEAREHLSAARRLVPDNLTARWLDFQMPLNVVMSDESERVDFLARWKAGIEYFEKLELGEKRFASQAGEVVASATNFYLAYLGAPLVTEQKRNARVLRNLATAAGWTRNEVDSSPIGSRRRKIAVFTASINLHSVSIVWSSALLALDPAEFEIGAFYAGTFEDVSTKRWRQRARHFEGGSRSVEEWIDSLRAFAPDILIFPDIGMSRLVQAVASVRLASVQVATWGHPVTSGMATIDFFLGADVSEPENASDHYAEKLVRLPRLGTYLDLPEQVPPVVRRGGQFRFLCSQSADKLHPAHDALFAEILVAAPNARLDVLCSKPPIVAHALEARMRREFVRHGLDFDARCSVHPMQSTPNYHGFLAKADACLDSLDFSGCITSLDALWRNLPIVTLPSGLMRGRQTYGILRLLELEQLVARDASDYVRMACSLVQDDAWRAMLTTTIAERKCSLYQDNSVVEALADFLRTIEPPTARASD